MPFCALNSVFSALYSILAYNRHNPPPIISYGTYNFLYSISFKRVYIIYYLLYTYTHPYI